MFDLARKENPLDKAVRILRGYCLKQEDCSGCRFAYGADALCILCRYVPCDWPRGGGSGSEAN